jgi:hypothetical protein
LPWQFFGRIECWREWCERGPHPGIVKMLEGRRADTYPDMAWEPKVAFNVVAGRYRS